MSQTDPTDHALATIASILDHPAERPPVKSEDRGEDRAVGIAEDQADEHSTAAALPVPEPVDVDNYVKIGPGPLDAIRFRWAARRDENGQYFVDEMIGPNSRPMTTGPMPKHEVIDFINAKASAAQSRFDALKREMTLSRHAPDDGHHESES